MTMSSAITNDALAYHCLHGKPGKVAISATKPLRTQRDLSLAYTPGVAAPVLEIERDPSTAYLYTAKSNLVAVISNGTAVLGLGNRGALASKPVMEGKAVLFKRFADIDVFDIEVNATDPGELIRIVAAISPTFGGINLEDIKAPECFRIERELDEMLDIPVFHDDQHGTAIITAAALLNGLELVGKDPPAVRLVVSGAGAAAMSCVKLAMAIGIKKENVLLVDSSGVIYRGRTKGMNDYKQFFAADTTARTMTDAIRGADVFYGLSAGGLLTKEMVRTMAPRPLIFALANPDPEIRYEDAKAERPDAIVATGRSDYPNQINNVLGFPSIFRGALDTQAKTINEAMKLAAARALAALAKEEVPTCVRIAYGANPPQGFGPDYLIPTPFDPRVLLFVAPAVATAAMESGVARRQIDPGKYQRELAERMPDEYRAFVTCENCLDCKHIGQVTPEPTSPRPAATAPV
jgi:malate dehydrogenase (oxaloacetate-decarboxylating)(NADP+)